MNKLKHHKFSILLIFSILCLNKLGFQLTGGEEEYLAFSKQYMNPAWIQDSFSMTEYAGTRIVFQLIFGSILYFFDFEFVVFFGRIINFLLISVPLAFIFNHLKFKWIHTLIIIQLFVMSSQNFFGGEWMIGGLEPKSFAYIYPSPVAPKVGYPKPPVAKIIFFDS